MRETQLSLEGIGAGFGLLLGWEKEMNDTVGGNIELFKGVIGELGNVFAFENEVKLFVFKVVALKTI